MKIQTEFNPQSDRLPGGKVTSLFTDIQGSTELLKALGEGYAQVLTDQRRILRTAKVVATELAELLQVPAETLRSLMVHPALSQLFLEKMTERLNRTSLSDLPRFAGYDQAALRDLRTAPPPNPQPEPAAPVGV